MTWEEIDARARVLATELSERGAGPTAGVAYDGPTALDAVVLARACLEAGTPLTILPRALRAGATSTVGDHALRATAPALISRQGTLEPWGGGATRTDGEDEDDDPPCVVQLTSGSTGPPTSHVVRRSQLAYQATATQRRSRYEPTDHLVSWLPLYHDMGLIAFLLTPMVLGLDLTLVDPATFARQPLSWPRLIDACQGTVTAAPQFAYSMLARRLAASGADLSSLRIAYNGAEPVQVEASTRFADAAATGCGFDPRALLPVYGLAEATLAVTIPPPGTGVRAVRRNGVVDALLGPPLDGTEIRIRPLEGDDVPDADDLAGEVEVASPSVTTPAGAQGPPEWLATGDLGRLHEGELVVTGRLKEIIIVAGQNVAPHVIEVAVQAVPDVRPGGVAAVALANGADTQAIGVMVETRRPSDALARTVADAVEAAVGSRPAKVELAEPGSIPKTTSGKIRRAAVAAHMGGEVQP
ncbi:MAG TPA: AMP-binding protein [Iamia sp.]